MPVVETIAVVASIIAIIQISDRVISACKFYIQALSDTPSELRAVLVEISTLKSVLESLQFLKTYAHAAPALWEQLSGQDGPIEECRRSITELEKLFPTEKNSIVRSQSGPERHKVQFVHSTLAWAFKVRRVRELLPIIIRQKAMINLALTTESSQEIKLIKKDTADIRYMLTGKNLNALSESSIALTRIACKNLTVRKFIGGSSKQILRPSTTELGNYTDRIRVSGYSVHLNGTSGCLEAFRWAVCQLDRLQRLKCERQIIRNTLATLPKTLDETYERIFMDIPKDEWSFARHALQWVCFHRDMYGDNHAMSLQILLAATELSTCNEAHQESDFEYDAERLRNMLGCLIDVNEDNIVLLAHYTVKEYLESQRISESAAGYFWTGQEAIIRDCARTILQEAQAIDWPEKKAELLFGDDIGDTPDAFLQDLVVYCTVSSLMLLLTRQNAIASDELLLPLAVEFVNPTLDHFDDLSWICDEFQNTVCFFSDQDHHFKGDHRFPVWLNQQDCVETKVLLHFLVMGSYCDFPILADAFLNGKNVDIIAQNNVTFCMRVDHADELWILDGMYTFDGSLLEVMAQLSFISAKPFVWLLDQCDKPMDTGLLIASIGFHGCFHDEEHKDRCALRNSLGRHADPDATGYLITPLQIAVASRDIEGVTELLEAGADPNTTGDQNGVSFKTNSIFESFNELHGLSPLHICRTYTPLVMRDDHVSKQIHRYRENNAPAIEGLLLQHSAREFSS
ncbi:hypothetical protein SLS60_000156 [Paraconiothyrium brasiliense]|uniref:Fungal N-terminal domain-containing protein n=1 Tax=Paraconiothyrium brasiliense TaxID=300254 RepID=A0ABR3S5I0_9PLEO